MHRLTTKLESCKWSSDLGITHCERCRIKYTKSSRLFKLRSCGHRMHSTCMKLAAQFVEETEAMYCLVCQAIVEELRPGYTREAHVSLERECPICIEALGEGEEVGKYTLLCCGARAYHQECLERWMDKSPRCPICKQDFVQSRRYKFQGPYTQGQWADPIATSFYERANVEDQASRRS